MLNLYLRLVGLQGFLTRSTTVVLGDLFSVPLLTNCPVLALRSLVAICLALKLINENIPIANTTTQAGIVRYSELI